MSINTIEELNRRYKEDWTPRTKSTDELLKEACRRCKEAVNESLANSGLPLEVIEKYSYSDIEVAPDTDEN